MIRRNPQYCLRPPRTFTPNPLLTARWGSALWSSLATPVCYGATAPVGPVADQLARLVPVLAREGVTLVQVRRDWDSAFWPHAKKGFFAFKERIPALLRQNGLA